jgi:integrase
MAIFKRGKTWWVRFTSPSGSQIRQSAGTQCKKQAEELHDRLKSEIWRTEKLGDKPRHTWQEATVRWLEEKDQKADLLKDVGKLRWLDQILGDCLLDEVSRDMIDLIAKTKKHEASASTANRYLALVRAILRAARDDWDWIDKIPHVRLSPEPKRRVRWISEEQAARLIEELPPHLAIMAAFSLATGLRQSNVTYLRWDQVDLRREIAWIHADQSKSRKAMAVPLNADAMRVLKQQKGQSPAYVFVYQDKPVGRTTTKAWHAALERADIKDFRWHDLRHTWASWHVQRGTSLQELQELGGWATFEMVLRYAHLAADHLKSAASRIEGTISAQPEREGCLRLIVSR